MVLRKSGRRNSRVVLRRVVWRSCQLLFRPAVAVSERVVRATASYRRLEGFSVGFFDQEAAKECSQKVAEALALVRSLDPKRFERMRRDVELVQVFRMKSSQFSPRWWTCLLDEALVRERSAALIASTLVHEATHARVLRAGIPYWPDLQQRIEALCTRQEIAFASKLPRDRFPNTDNYIQYLRQKVQPQAGS